jgi:hypothetical protein
MGVRKAGGGETRAAPDMLEIVTAGKLRRGRNHNVMGHGVGSRPEGNRRDATTNRRQAPRDHPITPNGLKEVLR